MANPLYFSVSETRKHTLVLSACELQQPELAVMWGRRGTGLCCSLWVLCGFPSPSLSSHSPSLEALRCTEWKASVGAGGEFAGAPAVSATLSLRDPPARCLLSQVVPGGVRLGVKNNSSSSLWSVLAQLHRGGSGSPSRGAEELWRCGTGGCGRWGWGSQKPFPTLMVLCEAAAQDV